MTTLTVRVCSEDLSQTMVKIVSCIVAIETINRQLPLKKYHVRFTAFIPKKVGLG